MGPHIVTFTINRSFPIFLSCKISYCCAILRYFPLICKQLLRSCGNIRNNYSLQAMDFRKWMISNFSRLRSSRFMMIRNEIILHLLSSLSFFFFFFFVLAFLSKLVTESIEYFIIKIASSGCNE